MSLLSTGGDDVVGGVPEDSVVVAALRGGDEAMFAALLDAWSRGMIRLARTHVSTTESAEEVVQDTWLAVIRGIGGFEGRSSLKTWVYRILVNTAKRRGAGESHTVTVDQNMFQGEEDPFPGHWKRFPPRWPSPESTVLAEEVREQVSRALQSLPVRQRAVITLRDVEGYTSEEVCEILEISAANQRVLLHRARTVARECIGAYFDTGEVP
jgi:RNA polymerase sigma-70 factor (ECF subfamily)